jgi:hypothetical protein
MTVIAFAGHFRTRTSLSFRSSTTSMVADSLSGSTPMATLPTPFLLALEHRLKAGRAMRMP